MGIHGLFGKLKSCLAIMLLVAGPGCGTGVFNPAFINTAGGGGAFPVTPGPSADFVLVRLLNQTSQNATYFLTVWSDVLEQEDDGSFSIVTERNSYRADTGPTSPANEIGILFPCSDSEVNVVGLGGEDLLPTDNGVFVGGGGAGGALGQGVSAPPPLRRELGDFACGDTIIFRTITSLSADAGVKIESFLLSGSLQPSIFSGRSTFENYQAFVESQVREDN